MADTTITGADMESAAATLAGSDASAAASTTEQTGPSSSATTQPTSEPDLLNDPSWGDIPPSRRPSIAENFRKRAEADRQAALDKAKQEWESSHWAKDIDPQEAAVIRDWYRRGNTDPVALVTDLYQRVQNDPNYGPRLRSEAARILGGGRAQPTVDQDPMPPPDIPTDASNGQPIVYSAQQLQKLLEWQHRRSMTQFNQALQPYQQDLQTRQEQAQWQQMQVQSDAYAATTLKEIVDLPGFKEHKDAIRSAYEAMGVKDRSGQIVPDPNDPRSEGEKLRDCYLRIVVPRLGEQRVQQTVADLHRKAHASTVNPAQTNRGEPFDYKNASWEEALQYEWNRRKTG